MDAGSGKDTLSFPGPGLEIDRIVLEGGYGRALAFGLGHRDTHFSFLKRLRAYDEIVLHTTTGTLVRYRVSEIRIVDSRAGAIEMDARQSELMLVTCYPFDAISPGGPLRYVVKAQADAPRPPPPLR